ncbi:uncharacterized protein SPPG_03396 [Spizellomyces punctatus DAOM BR117]|uniref:Letm1 RBD domain-containing protein n=1 Tax=Spizellomyces punctatus (strain DAOM BR117) TaxID=645134 RepID=A0A0L0HKQ3_SPIPD|nr:uncharacterized protein SPPG_03396 [Spizellomyces punctatus DAOM BR117]KND01598.1 hypothetical protein SPPG_03396 [Spizellomyces punctatus DAOM BR117]|eukprot:XP_016609637.1 hypothetical protein SPPG_03396 [Spizellomyces punctatus DAOM BR117]
MEVTDQNQRSGDECDIISCLRNISEILGDFLDDDQEPTSSVATAFQTHTAFIRNAVSTVDAVDCEIAATNWASITMGLHPEDTVRSWNSSKQIPIIKLIEGQKRQYASISTRPIPPTVAPRSANVDTSSASTAVSSSSPQPQKNSIRARLREYARKSREMVRQFITGSRDYLRETREAKELKKRKVVNGYEWTRKEYFLVKKNEQDFWRAIPFMFCCVFLGEAIPFLLIRGIVPSTCLTVEQLDARWKRLAGVRKKLAAAAVQSVDSGEAMPASAFLSDDFVLRLAHTQPQYFLIDNLTGPQLRAYNKYLGIWRVGPAPYLRRVLRQHVDYIRGDDLLLKKEGLESLTPLELKWAVEARGLPSTDATPERMREDLSSWIRLHINDDQEVPFSLMLLTAIIRVELQSQMKEVVRVGSSRMKEHPHLTVSTDSVIFAEEQKSTAVASG